MTGEGSGRRADGGSGEDAFLERAIPRLGGRRFFRLGLSGTFGADEGACREALERANYVFWSPRMKGLTPALRDALRRDRDRYAVATGPLFGYFPGSVRRAVEGALRTLGTERLDVLQLFWLGKMSAFTGAVQEEMVRLKEEGKVGALGASTHDRPRAGRLAESSVLDLLMVRYNAAHPGAERDVFPHLAARRPAVVAYTATCWRKLLVAPKGWTEGAATAADCYRFVLSNDAVDVVLCAPRSAAEWREDARGVERGPLSAGEAERMRRLGAAVRG